MALRRCALAVLIGTSLLGLAGCGNARTAPAQPPAQQPAGRAGHLSGAFISLWPACACGRSTMLVEFSLQDGSRIRILEPIQVRQGESLATPAVDRAGRVWLTYSSGPQCTSNVAGCGPKPDSCAGHVDRLDPATGASATVLNPPASEQVSEAIPRPDGRQVVLVEGGCVTGFFNQYLVVRDLASGHQWSIGADAAPCHELSTPSWNRSGSELVFAYGPSVLSRRAHPTPGTCEAAQFNRLVIVDAEHASSTRSWRLINARHGCSYQAATFDREGVAAVEGCVQGEPAGRYSVNGGEAFLVQLNHRERTIHRVALKPGWEQGAISTEPNGTVLVSQDQPANSGYPERDWVWEWNGRRLRLVAHYRAQDAAQVIAIPMAAP